MNRDFVYNNHYGRRSAWSRFVTTANKWLWGVLCCGVPGSPCVYITCCQKRDRVTQRDHSCINQATATVDRLVRPHRPHAPGRKASPETLLAVRCALSQLGEPAPPLPIAVGDSHMSDPG